MLSCHNGTLEEWEIQGVHGTYMTTESRLAQQLQPIQRELKLKLWKKANTLVMIGRAI